MGVTVTTGRASTWHGVRPWLGTAVRLGLAAVWLFAGAAKVGDLAASGRAVNAYQVMPYEVAKVVGAALPFVELALGVLLLVGLATRVVAGISAALLLVFIAGIASAWARGSRSTAAASARGASWPRDRAPTYGPEILRDVGFLVLAAFLLVWPRTRLSVDSFLERSE